jgi:hypothetical protein
MLDRIFGSQVWHLPDELGIVRNLDVVLRRLVVNHAADPST